MIPTIDLPPQGGALQRTRTKVKSERNQRVELPIGKRHGDKAQDGAFGGLQVLAQQGFGLFGGDALGKPFIFLRLYHMPITNGGVSCGTNVHRWRKSLKFLNDTKSFFCYVTHLFHPV